MHITAQCTHLIRYIFAEARTLGHMVQRDSFPSPRYRIVGWMSQTFHALALEMGWIESVIISI
jgi:hypothetical protein